MKNILIVGGAGFIGSHFIRHILKGYKDCAVLNYDNLTYSGNLENLLDVANDKRYHFIEGDISDRDMLHTTWENFKPTHIINFAAETHVDRSIHADTGAFFRTNITGVYNILEEAKRSKTLVNYVQVSTDEVYGSLDLGTKESFKEDTAFAPNVPYSATKASGDLLCRAYFKTFNVPVVVTHCSNNYGPNQYPEKLIPFLTLRMLQKKTLPLYGDGKNVRDWIYVEDHCHALALCLFNGIAGETYNVGAENELSNLTIAEHIGKFFNAKGDYIEFIKDRPGHDRRYAIDSTKIQNELGWKPQADFSSALAHTLQWYVNHPKWIENILAREGSMNAHIK